MCLSGGPDLDPSLYGEELDPKAGPIDSEVDRFELELARARTRWGCRCWPSAAGWTLNVARGGTLLQHLDDHRQKEPGTEVTHDVTIEPGSRLAQVMGATTRRSTPSTTRRSPGWPRTCARSRGRPTA